MTYLYFIIFTDGLGIILHYDDYYLPIERATFFEFVALLFNLETRLCALNVNKKKKPLIRFRQNQRDPTIGCLYFDV